MSFKRGLVLTLCALILFITTACQSETPAQKTVHSFLDAYKAADKTAMDKLMQDPGTLGTPYVISDLPQSVLDQYQKIFVDFTYDIEKEEILQDKANVYVSITYKDSGNPSINAFNDYQAKASDLAFNGGSQEQLLPILQESFMTALTGKLDNVTETIVVPLERDKDGNWKVVSSGTLQNALTANLGVLVNAIQELNDSVNSN